MIADKNGTIEYVNPTFSQVTGYSARETIRTLGPPAGDQPNAASLDTTVALKPGIDPATVARIRELVEIGDTMQIKSIAEELKSGTDGATPFHDELIRLAEGFDFGRIEKMMAG